MLSAIRIYRIGNWCHRKGIPLLPRICGYFNRHWNQCNLPPENTVGKNLYLALSGLGIVIHWYATIGDNVRIAHFVTVGGRAGQDSLPISSRKSANPAV